MTPSALVVLSLLVLQPGAPQTLPAPGGSPIIAPGQARPAPPTTQSAPAFPESVQARAEIDAALARAKAERQRVLVLWGSNAGRLPGRLVEALKSYDIARLLRLEYQVVWVNVAEGENAKANRAECDKLGGFAKPAADPNALPLDTPLEAWAWATVLDAQGKPIANASTATWKDILAQGEPKYTFIPIQDFLSTHRQPQTSAPDTIAAARASAGTSGKPVLAVFHDPDDRWCVRFHGLLQRPRVASILSSRFGLTLINMARTPQALTALEQLEPKPDTLPYFAVIDASGKRLAASQTDPGTNIGWPSGEDETVRFLRLLDTGKSPLSPEDQAAVREELARPNR